MDFATKLLLGILASVVAWLISSVVMFFLKRRRMENAIVCDLEYRAFDAIEGKNYLAKLFAGGIKAGQGIDYASRYTRDENDLYKSMQTDLIRLFGRRRLLKIIKVYKAYQELDVLTEGLMLDLTEWKDAKKSLSEDDVNFLLKKKERIVRLCDILTKREIHTVDDLPDDYRGRAGPDSVAP